MYLVLIAWAYVVLLMAVAEATSTQGSVLGALATLLLYGVLPLAIVLYLFGTPARRRAQRKAREAAGATLAAETVGRSTAPPNPDRGDHAAGDAVAPERKEA